MFERPQGQSLLARLNEPPRFIQILAGPRQVGKTTLVNQVLSKFRGQSVYAQADLPVPPTAQWIEQQWQRALMVNPSSDQPVVLVLDEVQKVPRWSDVVKSLWDTRPDGLSLVLLGSSQFLMQSGLNESLMGRFEVIHLPHWSLTEMQSAFGFTLSEYLCFGGYPGPASLRSDPERWRRFVLDSIIEPTISRDVLSLARVNKPALLRRLMQLGCSYSGQMLSYHKILGQLQDVGNTVTLAHYLDLLSASWMVTGLNKFAGDLARTRGSSPKFQVFDPSLHVAQGVADIQTLCDSMGSADPDVWGRLVESAVGAHILNTTHQGEQIYYWRERNAEVDFVIVGNAGILAIEVESGGKLRTPSGLAAFQRRCPESRVCVVGTAGIPVIDFLSTPVSRWYLEWMR